MTVTPSAVSRSAIVTRLRSAGCVFAEDEAELLIAAAGTPAELAAMVDRRASGLPLEHVVGWAEFYGLRIAVEPAVFVPRRRTELLVLGEHASGGPQPGNDGGPGDGGGGNGHRAPFGPRGARPPA